MISPNAMKPTFSSVFSVSLAIALLCVVGCETMDFSVKKHPHPQRKGVVEENLDEDLNATEQAEVDPIFEKDEEQHRRDEKAVFGIP